MLQMYPGVQPIGVGQKRLKHGHPEQAMGTIGMKF